MRQEEQDELKKVLKQAMPSVGERELRRDLWPAMLRRLDGRSVRVPWWDWVLLAGASLMMLLFPGVIPALLYHL